MNRVLEAIFQRPMRFLILLVLPLIISLVVVYALPRSYQSEATLWALQPFQIVGQTTSTSANYSANTPTTPAGTQVAVLTEMLQTRSFALTIAKETNLQSTLNMASSSDADTTLFKEISSHVKVTTQGDDTFIISYTSTNPHVAEQVVNAVIQNYAIQSQALIVSLGQKTIESYQSQLTDAQNQVQQAINTETQFLQTHPGASLANSPQYAQLDAQRTQAQTRLQNIQTTIDSTREQIIVASGHPDTLFNVIDVPIVPIKPVSKLVPLLLGGVVGLIVALLMSVIYLIVLVRRDYAIYTPSDLQKVSTLPVVMQLPRLASQTVLSIVDDAQY